MDSPDQVSLSQEEQSLKSQAEADAAEQVICATNISLEQKYPSQGMDGMWIPTSTCLGTQNSSTGVTPSEICTVSAYLTRQGLRSTSSKYQS